MKNRKQTQAGFTLIEILIALMVLAVGLLGLGGLQIAGVKGSNTAHYRTTASMLAMNLAERIRTNRVGTHAGYYDDSITACDVDLPVCRNTGTNCSPETLAKYDLQEIQCGVRIGSSPRQGGVKNLLPNGAITVSCVGGCNKNNAVHDISISWYKGQLDDAQDSEDLLQSIRIPVLP